MKILILAALFFLFTSGAFAVWDKRPEFRWQQLYRYDLRQKNHQLYTNRLSLIFNYLDNQQKSLFKVIPFFEIRRNIDKDLWGRKELGIEIGKDIFPWVYLGEEIQRSWRKEDYRYYGNYEKRDHTESETRLMFSHNLLPKKFVTLKGFILNEYTYDFDRGAGICNEVAIGLIAAVGKYIETGINWRHIDRIHYYDSDTFEGSVIFVF